MSDPISCIPAHRADLDTCADLETLARKLMDGKPDDAALNHFHTLAMGSGRARLAGRVYARLRLDHPGHAGLLSFSIAAALQCGDHETAIRATEDLLVLQPAEAGLIDAALAIRQTLGPMQVRQQRSGRPSLSLCMIVRQEAAMLPACLHAVKPLVDEMVIVDTGSSDRSADIARVYGARVFNFAWQDDFAAARNAGLENARGDWILILDADEIIASEDHPALIELLNPCGADPVAYSITTRNYTSLANTIDWQANDGSYPAYETGLGWFPSRKVRLFARNDRVRFCYPVHERLDPALKAAAIPIVNCTIPVHHYGQLNEARNREKALRYFELGMAKLDRLGNDAAALRELAVQAGQLERWNTSKMLWQKLLDLHPGFAEAYVNLSNAEWQMENYDSALAYARRSTTLPDTTVQAFFNEAVSLLMLGRFDEAEKKLLRIVRQQPNYLAANFMLAVSAVGNGNRTRAAQVMNDLIRTPAVEALPKAGEDIGRRLQAAGHGHCARQLNYLLAQICPADRIGPGNGAN